MASSLIVVSAPGKVILHGEHAVVYGKAALAASVDLRCYLVLKKTEDGKVTLDLPDFQHKIKWSICALTYRPESSESELAHLKELSGAVSETPPTQCTATLVFLYLLTHICGDTLRELQGLHATVLSSMPASAGLGSSAAFSVCLAAGLLSVVGTISSGPESRGREAVLEVEGQRKEDVEKTEMSESVKDKKMEKEGLHSGTLPQSVLDVVNSLGRTDSFSSAMPWSHQELEIINQWGLEAEKLIHGTPSGIDNSVSTFGGAIRFHSGQIHPLQRMPQVRILLVNTKVSRSTKKMVAGVRELHNKYPLVVGPILNSMGAITDRAEELLAKLATVSTDEPVSEKTKIHRDLHDLFVLNQHLLNAVGVGHPALDRVCELASRVGLAAKLTGAGGGGCAIVLVPPGFSESKLREAKDAFITAGFDCWETTIGSKGVCLHCDTS